jgi:hypothetical protein
VIFLEKLRCGGTIFTGIHMKLCRKIYKTKITIALQLINNNKINNNKNTQRHNKIWEEGTGNHVSSRDFKAG